MAYQAHIRQAIQASPTSLGGQLGRLALRIDFPAPAKLPHALLRLVDADCGYGEHVVLEPRDQRAGHVAAADEGDRVAGRHAHAVSVVSARRLPTPTDAFAEFTDQPPGAHLVARLRGADIGPAHRRGRRSVQRSELEGAFDT